MAGGWWLMATDQQDVTVDIDGRSIRLTNLDKVLYPSTGTTKAEVITYYTAVAPAILPLLRDRPVTRKRWPNGVDEKPFFEKNLPAGTPDWVPRVTLQHSGDRSGRGARDLDYPLVHDVATLVWLSQGGALELHAPQWRFDPRQQGPAEPDRLVIDLDPGPPAGLDECCRVALVVRRMLGAHGFDLRAVTSGSKGMQLYAPLPPSIDRGREVLAKAGGPAEYTHAAALALERELPDLVVSQMARELRPGRVFIDWSQNNPAKTTIVPWSLRGLRVPTAAVPVSWNEIERGGLRQRTLQEATALATTRAAYLADL
jgi:bifunctional non-homologous end joining protein LigD